MQVERGEEEWKKKEEEAAKERERKQERAHEEENWRRREERERMAREERVKTQRATVVGFGKYCGRACEWVYNQDQHCEWVSRQESSNKALSECQEFVRVAERREKRKELETREKEKGRRMEEGAGEGGRKRAIEEMRDVLTRVRTNTMAMAEMAAAEVSKTVATKTDAMAGAETDVAVVARKVTTAAAEQKVKVAEKDDEESAKCGAGWKRGKSAQEMLGTLERSAAEWRETGDVRRAKPSQTVWHTMCTWEEESPGRMTGSGSAGTGGSAGTRGRADRVRRLEEKMKR